MSIKNISNSDFSKAKKAFNSAAKKVGENISKVKPDSALNKFINGIEPTGSNNSFPIMTSLMVGTVILPRVITAAKRNPDNKEATKDEITEILFRDVITVITVLFALKSMNSVIAGLVNKKGLPMTNKPYRMLFDTKTSGLKGIDEKAKEFVNHPLQKLKVIAQNALDVLHPTDGIRALTNDEFVAKYSNYNSFDDVVKMFNQIEADGGDKKKVLNNIIDDLIKKQEDLIKKHSFEARQIPNINGSVNEFDINVLREKRLLKNLKDIKNLDFSDFEKIEDKSVKDIFVEYLKNPDNTLVMKAKKLNAGLRTFALALEASFLGFGLPTLNQKRLEKKYLGKNKNQDIYVAKNNADNSSTNLIDRNIKAHEIKLYHNFIK